MLVLVPLLTAVLSMKFTTNGDSELRACLPLRCQCWHVARRAAGWDGEHHQEDYSFFALTLVGSVLDIERGPRHAHDGEGSSEWYRCPSSSSSELLDNFGRGGDTL